MKREESGMRKVQVLLAGETWLTGMTHTKGFDHFFAAEYQTGIDGLKRAVADSEIELHHLPGHQVPTQFPVSREELERYDVLVLSDIGANSFLLHPDTFNRGQRTPNRLRLIAEWVEAGGGFLMAGGYLSFQGIGGAARFHRTPVETILPVGMLPVDDRVEVPEGFTPMAVDVHPITAGLGPDWPYLLGFNETVLKPGSSLLLAVGGRGDASPLLAVRAHGRGRTMAWTSDISPHWLPRTFMEWPGYSRLWRQAFLWLAGRL